MSWINDVLNQSDLPLRGVLDTIKSDIYNQCNYYVEQGATVREAYSIVYGLYEIITDKTIYKLLYLDYVNDWYTDNEEDDEQNRIIQ